MITGARVAYEQYNTNGGGTIRRAMYDRAVANRESNINNYGPPRLEVENPSNSGEESEEDLTERRRASVTIDRSRFPVRTATGIRC